MSSSSVQAYSEKITLFIKTFQKEIYPNISKSYNYSYKDKFWKVKTSFDKKRHVFKTKDKFTKLKTDFKNKRNVKKTGEKV